MSATQTFSAEDHLTGETFTPDVTKPFRLRVEIDNQDGAECPDNPWTTNAYLGDSLEPLVLNNGGGAIIDGTIPEQLRALAGAIERGEVYA